MDRLKKDMNQVNNLIKMVKDLTASQEYHHLEQEKKFDKLFSNHKTILGQHETLLKEVKEIMYGVYGSVKNKQPGWMDIAISNKERIKKLEIFKYIIIGTGGIGTIIGVIKFLTES